MLCCASPSIKNEAMIHFPLLFMQTDSHTYFYKAFGLPLLKNWCYKSTAKTHNWIFVLLLPTHTKRKHPESLLLLCRNKRLSSDLAATSPSLKPQGPLCGPLERVELSQCSIGEKGHNPLLGRLSHFLNILRTTTVIYGCLKQKLLQQFHFLYHSCCFAFAFTDLKRIDGIFIPQNHL